MKTANSLKTLTYLTAATLISACGGGGGGGGGDTTTPPPGNNLNNCTPLQASAFSQRFNTYLPISPQGQLQYSHLGSEDVVSGFTYDSSESNTRGVPVYSNSYSSGGNDILAFLLTSDPGVITLHGLNGPIPFDADGITVVLDSLRFANSVTLYNGQPKITGNTTAAAVVRVGGIVIPVPDFIINYEIDSGDSKVTVNGNQLPSKDITLQVDVTIPAFSFVDETQLQIDTNLSLSKGIGVVANEINVVGARETLMQGVLSSTTNLPQPIWFQANGGTPVISLGSDATFSTSADTISAEEYAIANLDQINALDWIQINQDLEDCTFNVNVQSATGLPTDLTSIEVVFEDSSGDYTSGNVTIQ